MKAEALQAKAPKKRTINDLPGFDISASDMLRIIDAPCMMIKRGQVQFKVLEMLTLTLKGTELSALGIDFNTGQVISRGEVGKANGDMVASIPASQIYTLIRNMKDEDAINFRCDRERNRLVVRTGKNSYNIPLCNDEPPVVNASELAPLYSVTFPAEFLHRVIQRVFHSAAKNDVRFYMNGIYLSLDNGQFHAVATDGHRMAVISEDVVFTDDIPDEISQPVAPSRLRNESAGVILPGDVCPVIQKLLSTRKESLRIDYSERHLTFNLGKITVVSNLVNGRYPDWRRVANTASNNTEVFKINAEALRTALSRALPLITAGAPSSQPSSTGVISFKSNALMIQSPKVNSIECKEVLDIEKVAGDLSSKIEIGINCDYLLKSLNSLASHQGNDDAEITISLLNSATAVEVSMSENCRDIIMPIRV